jgi:rare lipoprotein A
VIENSDGTVTQRPVVQRPGNSTGNNRVDIANTVFVVQVAAFSSRSRADALAKEIGAKVFPSEDNSIWRVRYGPYANASAAESDLQKVRQNGYPNARILRASR